MRDSANTLSVCVTSAIRIVAVARFTGNDATYSQVYASSWTFMEMGIAVVSGNLPLFRPLFEHFFRFKGTTMASKSSNLSNSNSRGEGEIPSSSRLGLTQRVDEWGFERISEDGTEAARSIRGIELLDRAIIVKTDFTVEEQTARPHEELENRMRYYFATG
jgi:hypothetical protein